MLWYFVKLYCLEFFKSILAAPSCKSSVEPPVVFWSCVAHLASEPFADRHEMSDFVQLCMLMATSFGDLLTTYFKICLRLSKHYTDRTITSTGVALNEWELFLPYFYFCKRGYNLSLRSMQSN